MRILRKAPIEGNSGTWGLCRVQHGRIHARERWTRLPIPGSETYLSAVKEEAEVGMLSTVSFIQANLQHSIVVSVFISMTLCVQGIDVALIEEPWYREGCQGPKCPGIHPVLCGWDGSTSLLYHYEERDGLVATRFLL